MKNRRLSPTDVKICDPAYKPKKGKYRPSDIRTAAQMHANTKVSRIMRQLSVQAKLDKPRLRALVRNLNLSSATT